MLVECEVVVCPDVGDATVVLGDVEWVEVVDSLLVVDVTGLVDVCLVEWLCVDDVECEETGEVV